MGHSKFSTFVPHLSHTVHGLCGEAAFFGEKVFIFNNEAFFVKQRSGEGATAPQGGRQRPTPLGLQGGAVARVRADHCRLRLYLKMVSDASCGWFCK